MLYKNNGGCKNPIQSQSSSFTEVCCKDTDTKKIKSVFVGEDSKATQIISEKFNLINANIVNLFDAKIICLGESHDNEQDRKNNAEIINALCNDNDLILTEDKNDGVKDQAKYVKYLLPIKGWDRLDEKTLKAIHIAKKVKSQQKFFQGLAICLGIGFEEFIRWKFGIQTLSYWTYAPISCAGLYGCYKLSTFIRIAGAWELLLEGIPERNQHMIQKIEENISSNRRIYVIAGTQHFQPFIYNKFDEKRYIFQNKGYHILRSYLQKEKFAILVPKR